MRIVGEVVGEVIVAMLASPFFDDIGGVRDDAGGPGGVGVARKRFDIRSPKSNFQGLQLCQVGIGEAAGAAKDGFPDGCPGEFLCNSHRRTLELRRKISSQRRAVGAIRDDAHEKIPNQRLRVALLLRSPLPPPQHHGSCLNSLGSALSCQLSTQLSALLSALL